MKEFYKMTLTPNRSTGPRRGVRLVCYRRMSNVVRGVDEVRPYMYVEDEEGRPSSSQLRYRDIRPYPVDQEFAEDWAAHVRYQAALARVDAVG